MSESYRLQRVEKELQHIIANYLVRGFKGTLRGLVSVSRVESNLKLRTAKIFISVMGSDADRESSIEALNESIYEIQKHVNKELRMKFVPKISIVSDKGLERILKVESILRDLAQKSSLHPKNKE